MSRPAQTEVAVLGALSVRPITGYEARAAITETLGHFWHESFGQIYPTLQRLEGEGLARRSGAGRTSGSRFEITAAGRARLVELLATPVDSAPPRDGLLLRLFFGRLLGDDACRALLEDALRRAEEALATYAAIRREVESEAGDPDARYHLLTLSAGEHAAAARATWAREGLAAFGAPGDGGHAAE